MTEMALELEGMPWAAALVDLNEGGLYLHLRIDRS